MSSSAIVSRALYVGTGTAIISIASLAGVLAANASSEIPWTLITGLLAAPLVVLVVPTWLRSRDATRYAPILLTFVLAAFAFQRQAGFQITELLFALFFIPYICAWYYSRIVVYREGIAHDLSDVLIILFLLLIYSLTFVSVIYGADSSYIYSDWISMLMSTIYFPVKEICQRYKHGYLYVILGLAFMATIALLRNIILTREVIESAAAAWEVARFRVTANEMTLTAGALACAGAFAMAPRRWPLALAGAGFAAFTVGVVITQWRASYVALGIGLIVLALNSSKGERVRIGLLVLGGGITAAIILVAIVGPNIWLVAYGLLDRLLSIGTATTSDMSLINRFIESNAAIDNIANSPIIGHGPGTTFSFYDINLRATWTKPYAHNGYLSIWFKYGLIGLSLFFALWSLAIIKTTRCANNKRSEFGSRISSSISSSFLISMIPSFFVSAPFATPDTVFCFFMIAGLGMGAASRPLQRYAVGLAQ